MPSTLTATEIANLALGKLGPGGGYLTDLATDDSEAAEALRRSYVAVRDEVLETFPWRFAQKRASIAADTATPAWGYDLQYSLPADCLKVLAVAGVPTNFGAAYVEEGDKILTDLEAPLDIRYLAKIETTSKFSPTFIAALAARLADEVCETLTKSSSRREKLQIEYRAKLMQARKTDTFGVAQQPAPDGSWNEAREA